MEQRIAKSSLGGARVYWLWVVVLMLVGNLLLVGHASAQIPIPKITAKDTDGNGIADHFEIDRNGDGKVDLIVEDRNEDGKPDLILIDDNLDGKFDRGLVDQDYDGLFEFEWKDKNGDGKIDENEMSSKEFAYVGPGQQPEEFAYINYGRTAGQLVTYACSLGIISPELTSDGDCDGTAELSIVLATNEEQLPGFYYDVDEDGTLDAGLLGDVETHVFTTLWQDRNHDGQTQSEETAPVTTAECGEADCAALQEALTNALSAGLDLDGDGKAEQFLQANTIPWREFFSEDSDGDGALDQVILGTDEGATVALITDRNQDGRDEIVLTVKTLPLGDVQQLEIFADGQPDLIAVGVGEHGALAFVLATVIVVEDPDRNPEQSIGVDTNGDGKVDKIIAGTKGGSRVETPTDVNGDGKKETIISDPNRNPEQPIGFDVDGDGKIDVVVIGKRFGAGVHPAVDFDGDGDKEIVLSDPTRDPKNPITIDLDKDGDPDVIVVGTSNGATVKTTADVDGDGDEDIEIEDPTRPLNQPLPIDLDKDGDPDVTVVGKANTPVNPPTALKQLHVPLIRR